MSESVENVKVGIVELFYFCFLEINTADEDQQVFVEVGSVVHQRESRLLARGVDMVPLT
jgi:hypothetical protein